MDERDNVRAIVWGTSNIHIYVESANENHDEYRWDT